MKLAVIDGRALNKTDRCRELVIAGFSNDHIKGDIVSHFGPQMAGRLRALIAYARKHPETKLDGVRCPTCGARWHHPQLEVPSAQQA